MLQHEINALSRKPVELALAGNTHALKICLDRIAPPRRGRPIFIDAPPVDDLKGHRDAQVLIASAMLRGEVTPEEAAGAAAALERAGAAIERCELEGRVVALETSGRFA